ncbi:carbohydrate ABC transporter permease [Planomonospora venezuelensis]|uniref:Multiple sugar transport system permease protein n=1 Tax=Planomonospora venezuelensis TaxID=1999 RepID=A0A841D835_PLAVE|nr:sugar ABC transporter permease [Planomonospora venezuelensis]MBB5963576.1 multiple sugar transport system permease protein [Planomonospora venezuelensis]GIN02095.1 sugar ABC transporter permease [Planomonospora venezuelensis]
MSQVAAPPRRTGPDGGTPRPASRRRAPRRIGVRAVPYVMVAPFTAFFALFFLVPIGIAVYQSLHGTERAGLLGKPKDVFVGLGNYAEVLTDPGFHSGLLRVLGYVLLTIPVMLVLSAGFALILDSGIVRLRRLHRLAIFLPYAIPVVVATLVWGFFYQPEFSPIAGALRSLGFGTPELLEGGALLGSIANVAVWQWTGYNMIILIAALQAVPVSVYEAARLDGCGELALALRVKLPMLVPAMLLAFIFSLIGAFQLFNEPAVLRPLSSSVTADYTPNLYAYSKAFTDAQPGYAAAIAVVLALATFAFSFVFLRAGQRKGAL